MKIRPKVPVCTDCDHVFEYKGQNPGQLGGVVVQFGEAYCTKKKKPRLLKRWHKMLRVPDWCKKRIRPSLVRIYDFASTESWLMHENLCKSLGREIGPTASRYTLSEVRQLDLDAYAFQKQVRTTPVEELALPSSTQLLHGSAAKKQTAATAKSSTPITATRPSPEATR